MAIFNKRFGHQVNAIQTTCYVIAGGEVGKLQSSAVLCPSDLVLWDTGATDTVISKTVVDGLGLKPIGRTCLEGVFGMEEAYIYKISICTETGMIFSDIEAICAEKSTYDLVIGMDIISRGDFAVTNKDGQTWFSFRYPSKEHFEFKEV